MKEKYKWVECNHLHFNDTVSNQHFNEIEFISIIMTEEDIKTISSVIDEEKEFFNSVSQNIWNSPELSFQETFAHNILTDALIKYGFSVQRNYLLQTAFRAEFTTGEGPRIAVLLEYDALPEIGHACGHNLIAEAGLAAAVGIKAAMEADSSIKGTIVALGTPAEESGGGKVKLIESGAFEGIDAAMMVHPDNINWFQPILICLLSLTVDYKGRESHASAFPWEGVNALDAAVTLYQNIGLLRQQMKPSSQIRGLADNGMPEIVPVGSTDMGNVSYVVPSIHPHIGINTNSICHTKEFTTATGSPDAQLPTLSAAKAMAMTVLSLMRDRQKLDQAKAEFKDHMTDLS
nr:peptidase M20 domain-containing protein 2 isoform X4 [Parasteatoda tepidariorum]